MIITLLAVAIVLTGLVFGVWKGFAWQLAGIVSLVLGFIVAVPVSTTVAPLFGAKAPLNRFVAIAVLYGATSLGTYLVAWLYRKVLERWQLKEWDRHLGGVFGALKGWLIVLVLTFFAVTLSSQAREAVLRTHVGKYAAVTIDAIHVVFPKEVHQLLHPYIHSLDDAKPHD